MRTVITTRPSRHIEIWPHAGLRFLAASDAALESPGQGTGGFLVVRHDDHRQQREVDILMMPPATLLFQEDHSSVSTTITGQSQWLLWCRLPRKQLRIGFTEHLPTLLYLITGSVCFMDRVIVLFLQKGDPFTEME